MGRNKKKQRKTEDKIEILRSEDSEDDVPDQVHNRLLESIKQLHGKPKITPATRNEPAAEVSEFNLTTKDGATTKRKQFREKDLLQAIKRNRPKVARKLQTVKKPGTLPKPLESVHEKKAQREVAFGNVKKQLDRWDDVVSSNRLADQLTFPLKHDRIQVYDHTNDDLFSSLPNPTPLEKEISEVLNSSEIAKKHEEKLEKSRIRLTLKEMIKKRKENAKIKAQASYRIAKAWRQNKIKSKKYHRILRREKTKQQMKDFEILQKTDPEAALKQLEKLEKSRAEERATLRHRNTGKWAKNQLIKATYNKESRVALSEQLQKNRELTQKKHVEETDESDESDVGEEIPATELKKDSDNPWVTDSDKYSSFLTKYKKFWEEKLSNQNEQQEKLVNETVDLENKSNDQSNKSANEEKKSKKRKRTSSDGNSKKVAEIINSSGSWTVTENEPQKNDNIASESANKSRKKTKKVPRVTEEDAKRSIIFNEDFIELKKNLNSIGRETEQTKKTDLDKSIDPNKLIKISAKSLDTEMPEIITGGDEGLDDEDEDYQHSSAVAAAFAADNAMDEFEEDKRKTIEESQPKLEDATLPGWGSWTSANIQVKEAKKPKRKRINKRLLFRVPKAPPRKDANKGHVIIHEEKNDKIREHLVSDLPFPFTSVADYEASVRAPIGRTWLPETAHQKLIAPPIVTKLGTVIEPMDEGELLKREEYKKA